MKLSIQKTFNMRNGQNNQIFLRNTNRLNKTNFLKETDTKKHNGSFLTLTFIFIIHD